MPTPSCAQGLPLRQRAHRPPPPLAARTTKGVVGIWCSMAWVLMQHSQHQTWRLAPAEMEDSQGDVGRLGCPHDNGNFECWLAQAEMEDSLGSL